MLRFEGHRDVPLPPAQVIPVECLGNCKRACTVSLSAPGAWTYVFGDLTPEAGPDILVAAGLLAASADGLMPWRGRPEPFKRGMIARIPPYPALKDAAKHEDVQTRMWVVQAIGRLGDKPDVRFDMPLYELTAFAAQSEFKVFRETVAKGGIVKALVVKEGALLAILDAGAYGMSLASNYNSRPRAAEVMVEGKKARLIRKRETTKTMLAAEVPV